MPEDLPVRHPDLRHGPGRGRRDGLAQIVHGSLDVGGDALDPLPGDGQIQYQQNDRGRRHGDSHRIFLAGSLNDAEDQHDRAEYVRAVA